MISTLCQWLCNLNIESSFAFNQTSNIFHPKILYALSSVSDLSHTNLDTTFYTSDLGFSEAEVLCVLRSQGQASCLMAGLQEKTTYKSAPFPSGGGRARNILQWKAIEGAMSEVVREMAG